jgi:predicted AAA+ superfamily ATPase
MAPAWYCRTHRPARALKVEPSTTRVYLDLLTDALVLRQLQPWQADHAKCQSDR